MKRLKAKLRGRRGETLTELLVAILVMALAILMMASMVLAAVNINTQTRQRDEDFYQALTAAEGGQSKGEDADATVTIGGVGSGVDVPVTLYGEADSDLTAYGKKVAP